MPPPSTPEEICLVDGDQHEFIKEASGILLPGDVGQDGCSEGEGTTSFLKLLFKEQCEVRPSSPKDMALGEKIQASLTLSSSTSLCVSLN